MAYTIFSEKLTLFLKKQGMSQKELSLRTGIDEAVISRYIRGKNKPGAKNLRRIADALGVMVNDLTENINDVIHYDDYTVLLSVATKIAPLLTHEQKMRVVNALFSNTK